MREKKKETGKPRAEKIIILYSVRSTQPLSNHQTEIKALGSTLLGTLTAFTRVKTIQLGQSLVHAWRLVPSRPCSTFASGRLRGWTRLGPGSTYDDDDVLVDH